MKPRVNGNANQACPPRRKQHLDVFRRIRHYNRDALTLLKREPSPNSCSEAGHAIATLGICKKLPATYANGGLVAKTPSGIGKQLRYIHVVLR
jgi:hypothetical protein